MLVFVNDNPHTSQSQLNRELDFSEINNLKNSDLLRELSAFSDMRKKHYYLTDNGRSVCN